MSIEQRTIKIVGHRANDGGWATHSPQVRGVYGHGDSFQEALADWHAAAELYRDTFGRLELVEDPGATPDALEIETINT
ncbi:MAG: hypothetical protein ACR2QA_06095 [Solirubrobacteraceae bacterium]